MKRLFVISLVVFAWEYAKGQSVEVHQVNQETYTSERVLQEGDTLFILYKSRETTTTYVGIKNVDSVRHNYKITQNVLKHGREYPDQDYDLYYCWYNCFSNPGNPHTSTESIGIDPDSMRLDFSTDFKTNEHADTAIASYTVFDEYNPSDAIMFYVVYTEDPLGINTLADQVSCSIYPNPAQVSDVIYLKIQSVDNRAKQGIQVFVYDITGKCLQVSPVTGELSTIDLSSHAAQTYTLLVRCSDGSSRSLKVSTIK
jgi:hypothetical protein